MHRCSPGVSGCERLLRLDHTFKPRVACFHLLIAKRGIWEILSQFTVSDKPVTDNSDCKRLRRWSGRHSFDKNDCFRRGILLEEKMLCSR